MDKGKLEKELKEIDEKLKLKRIQIENSPEYKSLVTTQDDLWKKRLELERELKDLRKPIYKKYANDVHNTWTGIFFKPNKVKSSVKQGIKKGLGIKSVALIEEHNLKKIVMELVNKDLEKIKIQTDKLESEIRGYNTQVEGYGEGKNKLMEGLDALTKQRRRINNQLNLKNKIIEKKKKDVSTKIQKNLPKFMDRISKEVNKQLILDGLE